jgi:hypothetical protein
MRENPLTLSGNRNLGEISKVACLYDQRVAERNAQLRDSAAAVAAEHARPCRRQEVEIPDIKMRPDSDSAYHDSPTPPWYCTPSRAQ